jgi:hypothetical protein
LNGKKFRAKEEAKVKKLSFYVLPVVALVCLLTLSEVSGAKPEQSEDGDEAAKVETRLTELFELCKQGDAETAAAYFVYRGADQSRKWRDTFRASDAVEKAGVEELCRRIKGYLDESEGYHVSALTVERESEGEWHVLEVSFGQDGRTKKVRFAFLPIKGKFSLGDIDG